MYTSQSIVSFTYIVVVLIYIFGNSPHMSSAATNINECSNNTLNNCSDMATCTNTNGSFTCACNNGYEGDGVTCKDIVECSNITLNNCSNMATCTNTDGSFTCACNSGYEGDGVTCKDIVECSNITLNNCSNMATCTNTDGSFTCACNSGYEGDGVTCKDIVECSNITLNNCSNMATCTNTDGSFTCACNSGYEGDGVTCKDIVECSNITLNNCSNMATCTNTDGSFTCACNSGYEGDGVTCKDIVECSNITLNNCSNMATCTNTDGSFTCACNSGYEGDGVTCKDIVECSNMTLNNCSVLATCTNTNGSFTCACNSGYEGDGVTCTDIDECSNMTLNNCSGMATCTNINGSFSCACNNGYEGDGVTCTDTNQCSNITLNNCSGMATCTNTNGSFTCACKDGYTGDGTTCTDIDECSNITLNNCADMANCTNNNGSFTCACNSGYEGDGVTCEDTNECSNETLNNCSDMATCTNTNGSFTCACKSGFDGNGTTCTDIDECSNNTLNNCSDMATCTNTNGSFTCACNSGYEGDGITCKDIVECSNNTLNNCSDMATCTNTNGSFTCACKSGFDGNGTTCTDIDECNNMTLNNCSNMATCTNTDGSFTCACNSGYEGDGVTCKDINECSNNTLNNCSGMATCTNTNGSFTCACKSGFDGNGTTCTDINECLETPYRCSSNARCNNQAGTFNCTCIPFYEGNGYNCTDINECNNTQSCDANANCKNKVGGFQCKCKAGFKGDGHKCLETPILEYKNKSAINTKENDVLYGPYDMYGDIHAFGFIYSTIFVSSNGYIALGKKARSYPQPLIDDFPKGFVTLAPFWTPFDTAVSGKMFVDSYKACVTEDKAMLDKIGKVVSNDFEAKRALVVTWEEVPPYPVVPNYNDENITFQAILTSNEKQLYFVFNYDKDLMKLNKIYRKILIGYSDGKNENNIFASDKGVYTWLEKSTSFSGRRVVRNIGNSTENSMPCLDWYCEKKTTTLIGIDHSCPCTKQQAKLDGTFKMKDKCYETVFPLNGMIQRCCYDEKWGALLLGYPDGGFRYNASSSYRDGHTYCCKNSGLCNVFYKIYPSDTCQNYTISTKVLVWDPLEFNYLSGKPSSFYGSGEYTLLNASSGAKEVTIQSRVELVDNTVIPKVPVYTAFALKCGTSKMDISIDATNNKLTKSGKYTAAEMVYVPGADNEALIFFNNMQLKVSLAGDNMIATLSIPHYQISSQQGLISGNLPNGTSIDRSSKEDVYNLWKEWQVKEDASLFNYTTKNYSIINSDSVALQESVDVLVNLTRLLNESKATAECGNVNKRCIFATVLNKSSNLIDLEKSAAIDLENQENFPPRFQQMNETLVVPRKIFLTLAATDINMDKVTIGIDTKLPEDQFTFENGTFNWTFSQTNLIPRAVQFWANNSKNAISLYRPEIFICNCRNALECQLDYIDNALRLRNKIAGISSVCATPAYPLPATPSLSPSPPSELSAMIPPSFLEQPFSGTNSRLPPLHQPPKVQGRIYILPCICEDGYTGTYCGDMIDVCSPNPCYPNVTCNATLGKDICGSCPTHLSGNGKKCYDENNCIKRVCEEKCEDHIGNSYTCSCKEGYQLKSDNKSCEDIDECSGTKNNCSGPGQYCENTPGKYTCKCKLGYIDTGNNGCESLAGKNRLSGSLIFASLPNEVQSWSEDLKNLSSDAYKKLSKLVIGVLMEQFKDTNVQFVKVTSFQKSTSKRTKRAITSEKIKAKFDVYGKNMDPVQLQDVLKKSCPSQSCSVGSLDGVDGGSIILKGANICPEASCDTVSTNCTEDKSGYKCICKLGFVVWDQYRDTRCKDIDECKRSKVCGDVKCINTIGSYKCICLFGYVFDSKTLKCVDVCAGKPCVNGKCIQTENSFRCGCNDGWSGEKCKTKDPENEKFRTATIAVAAVLGSFCVIFIVVIVYMCWKSKDSKSENFDRESDDAVWTGIPRVQIKSKDVEMDESGSNINLVGNSNKNIYDNPHAMINPAFEEETSHRM